MARAINPSTLSILWDPPQTRQLNGMIQRYNVSISEIGTRELQHFSTGNESIVIPNLRPYRLYSYKVAAVTTGQGPYSLATLIQMPEAGTILTTVAFGQVVNSLSFVSAAPSSPPTDVQVTVVSSTGLLVSWSMPPAADHNGVLRSYTVSITEENTGREISLTSQTNSLTVDSLHPHYNYTCTVAAVTVSAGTFSAPITVTTEESGTQD